MSIFSRSRDLGGTIIAIVFIIMGILFFYDTTTMLDSDSYVFPRAIISILIVLSATLIIRNIALPHTADETEKGAPKSPTRRVMLVVLMLVSAAMMPVIGFMLAGLFAFLSLMMVAMFEKWTPFRLMLYPLIALALTYGLYALFKYVFYVPLPEPMWL